MNQQITGPGVLFSGAWKLFKAHWKILVPIAVSPTALSYLGQLMASTHQLIPATIGGIASLVAVVFSIAMGPTLANTIHRLSTEPGVKLSVNPQYKIGFGFFWSVILIAIINGLVFFGSVFLLIIPAIIVGVYGCLYLYTLVIDGKKGFSALTESYSLVHGRWAAVFGRMIVFGLVMLVIWIIMAGVAFTLGQLFGVEVPLGQGSATVLPMGALAVGYIVNLIGLSFILPLGAAYMYGLYVSLKATREANVQTGAFKKWLVAFICIGVIAVIVSLIALPMLFIAKAARSMQQQNASIQLDIKKLQQMIPASSTLPVRPE